MKEKLQFCTLFNYAYLSRGLTMYHSLLKHCDSFHLYIFAFDDLTYDFFNASSYDHITVISLTEFEDQSLLEVKPSRSSAEYCWTCTPSTIMFCIKNFNLNHCTYIDADLLFFDNPRILYEELKEDSVLITEHRYSPQHDQSATSGVYCVQFITFRNTSEGIEVLQWWRNACIEWCYARHEDGKFGDQKYLDHWIEKFKGIHVLNHLGGGVAPWNVQQYEFRKDNNSVKGIEKKSGYVFNVIFYHFHNLRFFQDNYVELTDAGYELPSSAIELLYRPYLQQWMTTVKTIESFNNTADAHAIRKLSSSSSLSRSISFMRMNWISFLRSFFSSSGYQKQHNHLYKIDHVTSLGRNS